MNTRFKILIFLLIAAGAFIAGSWVTYQGVRNKETAERKILHYVDPMNPALKSDKPGIAPCGMPLEPVYADQDQTTAGGAELRASMPPGTIRISPEKQQLIGVKLMTVEKAPWSHTLRVLGRVTPDETLVYLINAAVNGWIEETSPVTTGSMVKENDILATFYSLEYRNLVQNYFNLINVSKDGSPGEKAATRPTRLSVGQLKQLRDAARDTGLAGENAQIEYYRKNLYNFGMSPYQVEEMERSRTIPEFIEIRAPIAGFVIYRNVSPGLRFDRGAEFFRIADLSRVWIQVDLFETEASYFKPGMRVKMELPYQNKTLYAGVSNILPQFDPASRTLKLRLEAKNPGYIMRPDMFVNVELPASGPPAIIVPVGAVLDSGLKKTVFVDLGNGYFEPRQVETGRSLGERIEIIRGLISGEKIVVSGNFLIDSESRIQQAAAGITGKIARDPVCGMNIDEDRAREEGRFLEYKGRTYFFCESKERDEFRKDPEHYLKSSPAAQMNMMNMPPAAPSSGVKGKAAVDHSAHGMTEKTAPENMKAVPHDHAAMMTAVPKEQGAGMMAMPDMQSPAPMPGEKPGAMIPAAPGNTPPMMPGQGTGTAMPGMQGPAPMPSQMPGGMFPPASGNTPPMMPGQGSGAAMPGALKGTSMTKPAGDSNISPGAAPGMTGGQIKATDNGHAHD